MDLNLKRLASGKVHVNEDFTKLAISDSAWDNELLTLDAQPQRGQFVAHLRVNVDGKVTERLYALTSSLFFKAHNRLTLTQSIQKALLGLGVEVVNIGLFYKMRNQTFVGNDKTPVYTASNDNNLYVETEAA